MRAQYRVQVLGGVQYMTGVSAGAVEADYRRVFTRGDIVVTQATEADRRASNPKGVVEGVMYVR